MTSHREVCIEFIADPPCRRMAILLPGDGRHRFAKAGRPRDHVPMNTSWVLACLALTVMPVRADESAALAAADAHVAAHEKDIVGELRELLSLPNVATSDADMRANAALLVTMLEKRGVAARVLET